MPRSTTVRLGLFQPQKYNMTVGRKQRKCIELSSIETFTRLPCLETLHSTKSVRVRERQTHQKNKLLNTNKSCMESDDLFFR